MSTILFVFSRPPHGSINAQEGLDALLMGSAFTTCSVLFVGDGLMQLASGQSTDDLGTKNFSFCVLDIVNERILKWDDVEIAKSTKETHERVCTNLAMKLDELKLTKMDKPELNEAQISAAAAE